MSKATQCIEMGRKFPYDHEFYPDGDESHEIPPTPAVDWAHAAARGIVADLLDRSGIGNRMEDFDMDIKREIVGIMADIMREALAKGKGPKI